MRLKLTIEYAGTSTADGRCRKTREPFRVSSKARSARPSDGADLKCGAGRTDAGVHALAQVAHVDMDATVPPETFRRRVNDALPSDINVLRVERPIASTLGTTR